MSEFSYIIVKYLSRRLRFRSEFERTGDEYPLQAANEIRIVRMNENGSSESRLSVAKQPTLEALQPTGEFSMAEGKNRPYQRLLIVAPLVVQYSDPLFRKIAQSSRLDLLVAYCSMQGAESGVDPGFGVNVSWDTPLLHGYQWLHVPNRSFLKDQGNFFSLINPGLWTLVRDEHFSAVMICGYYFASAWIALAAAKWYGSPVLIVSDSHGLRSWRAQSSWMLRIKKTLLRAIFSLADGVVVSSSGGVEYLKSLGFPGERVVLAPTAVDNDWWTEQASKVDRNAVRATWNIPVEGKVALFCAKLQPWKGPMDLLEAFTRANIPNSYLVYAGDGPEKENLQHRVAEIGFAHRVRFLGFVNQSQLPSVYCAADLFVLPSLFEPFGLVVNEAMLCGLPVVVTDRVGAKFDLVRPEENGYVFPAGDVDALTSIIKDILPDTIKRARLSAAARQRMRTWSPREYADSVVRAVNLAAKE
jgi:glycosyltransferase involved in cell wall biosynthesis